MFLIAEFAVEDGLTKAGDLSPHSQPPVSGCFLTPNISDKFPNAPSLVTSSTTSEVCMSTHADPTLTAMAMVANFDAQALAAEENLKVCQAHHYVQGVCLHCYTHLSYFGHIKY